MNATELKRARFAAPRAFGAALCLALFAAACASGPAPTAPIRNPQNQTTNPPPQTGPRQPVNPITPAHLQRDSARLVRAAVLLPFSSSSAGARTQAASMLNAAELALFERGHEHLVLIPKDTGGTEQGARAAMASAVRDGADVILGPLFGASVRAVAQEAQFSQTPVIAFSNDRAAAGSGAYLLGFTPEEEVARIVEYAGRQDRRMFAAMLPDNAYGYRVRDALETEAGYGGGLLVAYEFFPSGAGAELLTTPARRLARFDERQGAGSDFSLPYDTVLLPEGGVRLLSLAPLLPFYDVDPREVRFLGTSLWYDDSVAREPSLAGGWFVAPDADARQAFVDSYTGAYGGEPSRLASLAYDAVALAAHLTDGKGASGLTRDALEDEDGFFGADGLFRLNSDGTSERGLAIYEVRDGEFVVLEPAPRSFVPSGF